MLVRQATNADVPVGLEFARAMHLESPRFSDITFSRSKAEALMCRLLDVGGAFVAEQNGVLVGMFGGVVVEYMFSEERYASDLAVYVTPPYRGSSAFIRLVAAFEQWAISQNAREIILGVSTDVGTAGTLMMYERLGYFLQGARTVLKRLPNV